MGYSPDGAVIAAPRYPVARKEPALRRFFRVIRRHWLLFQIDGARMSIAMYQRMINNDLQVARQYPSRADEVLPNIAEYVAAQDAEIARLTTLNIALIEFDHSV